MEQSGTVLWLKKKKQKNLMAFYLCFQKYSHVDAGIQEQTM